VSTYAEYDAIPGCDRWSDVKTMFDGPRSYRDHMDGPRESTDAMDFGSLVHSAVFEPDSLLLEYAVWMADMGNRAGNKWTDFLAQNKGKQIVREVDWKRALKVRDAVHSHPKAKKLLAGKGYTEHVITWTDEATGRPCKARVDRIRTSGRPVEADLKTTGAKLGNLRKFRNTCADLLYHGQRGMYRDGIEAALGIHVDSRLIVAEAQGAFEVAVLKVSPAEVWAGSDLFHRLLEQIAECEADDHWPFRYEDEEDLDLPPWAPGMDENDVASILSFGGSE
jgi:hypothetical protein